MNSNNPYETPMSDVSSKSQANSYIDDLSDEDIKKLNKFSSDINILGTISVLCVPGSAYYIYEILSNGNEIPIWPILGLLLASATAYSSFMRPNWGRPVCMIISLIMLPGFPIGTFLGYIGVRATIDGKRLFGDERITNHELGEAIAKIEQQSA
jgi:hypothetical protein